MHKLASITILFVSMISVNSAHADVGYSSSMESSYRLHLNGYAYHFRERKGSKEWNSGLWGMGLQSPLEKIEDNKIFFGGWNGFWEFDFYKDSFSDIAAAGGFAVQRKIFSNLDFGLRVGLVYEKSQREESGSAVLPYLLPYVETSFDSPVNMRMTLTPPIPALDVGGLVALQLIVDLH